MDCPRALVIGGSVGGLFAAHFLRAAGWDVTIFERSAGDLADRGASIGTRDDLFAIMSRLGIPSDPSAGVATRSRICLDRSGAIIHEIARSSISSAWDRIYRPLRDAFPASCYRAGMRLDRVEQNADRVTAIFADGSRAEGDLLIAADGIYSTVRAQFLLEVQPRYAGYVAWRGVIEESDLTPAEHALLYGRLSFCLPDGELVAGLGMPGREADARPGRRRYYWIWFRPANLTTDLPALCTDASGKCHGTSIPPALVRREVLRELREVASATLAPPIEAIIARTPQPFPHGIFDLESPRLVFGRVALLGDAAFVARPHVGAGITKAALDAQGLADAIAASSDLDAALARYERERHEFGAALVAWSRHLGAYLEAQLKPREQRRGAELERRPEIVLAEYGAAGKPV
jgi:2-polyprenyl-6-methoxyphenol hydroxylase-like FAD-dependent oxidoreductase